MKQVKPTTAGLLAALAKYDKLTRDLADLDAQIAAAGRIWSREQGNVFPLRNEALRRSLALAAEAEARKGDQGSRQGAARSKGE